MGLRVSALCGAIVVAAAVVGVAAQPADGAKRYWKRGFPGPAVVLPIYGWWSLQDPHVIRFNPVSVYRSVDGRDRIQRICLQYRIYYFLAPIGANWVLDWSRNAGCFNVRPGRRVDFASFDFRTSIPDRAYNAEVWIDWYVGKRRLASGRWSYNTLRDYRCQTIRCHVAYGYQNVAYIKFDYPGIGG